MMLVSRGLPLARLDVGFGGLGGMLVSWAGGLVISWYRALVMSWWWRGDGGGGVLWSCGLVFLVVHVVSCVYSRSLVSV